MATVDRQQWIETALAVLAERGIEAVRVEPLAKRLGVTKGSFYWHFSARPELLAAVLTHWEHERTELVIVVAEAAEAGPAERLRFLAQRAFGAPSATELAMRAWAAHDAEADAVLRRVDERRLAYVEGLFGALGFAPDRAKARARMLYTAFVGESQLGVTVSDEVRVAWACDNLAALMARGED